MEWNLKSTSWDFSEFEQEAISASGFEVPIDRGDFSVDLKLGQVNNPVDESIKNKRKELGVSKMGSLSSGPSKRTRATGNGNQPVSCLVDGCNSDLSNCRDYHRRHKVCELHSRTPRVTIGGQNQRFCQQCSRFHSLEEFDEGKRSCRKRLDGHNRRRRKPQPDSLAHTGTFLSNSHGTRFLPFSSSHVYPSTTVGNHTWSGSIDTKANAIHYNQLQHLHLPDKQNQFAGFSSSYAGGKQFTFLQGDDCSPNNQTPPEASDCQPLLRTIALSESIQGGHSMFCDRLTTRADDSDCALSLLSSPQTQSSGINLSHMVQSSSMPLVPPLNQSLHNHSLESSDSVLVPTGRDDRVQCPGMFHMGSGSSVNEAQTLPFHWE
ncbi:SBP domain-containing protein [Cephalotus follicularis]|uniref:SBP domain-containing protein n=1 Tax=Cephalotus follicularis TaxID=3775 RepID=A0A1Q3DCY9_CEPFO|nr:SBP domain-containing protein [Cephalotus follicularis]